MPSIDRPPSAEGEPVRIPPDQLRAIERRFGRSAAAAMIDRLAGSARSDGPGHRLDDWVAHQAAGGRLRPERVAWRPDGGLTSLGSAARLAVFSAVMLVGRGADMLVLHLLLGLPHVMVTGVLPVVALHVSNLLVNRPVRTVLDRALLPVLNPLLFRPLRRGWTHPSVRPVRSWARARVLSPVRDRLVAPSWFLATGNAGRWVVGGAMIFAPFLLPVVLPGFALSAGTLGLAAIGAPVSGALRWAFPYFDDRFHLHDVVESSLARGQRALRTGWRTATAPIARIRGHQGTVTGRTPPKAVVDIRALALGTEPDVELHEPRHAFHRRLTVRESVAVAVALVGGDVGSVDRWQLWTIARRVQQFVRHGLPVGDDAGRGVRGFAAAALPRPLAHRIDARVPRVAPLDAEGRPMELVLLGGDGEGALALAVALHDARATGGSAVPIDLHAIGGDGGGELARALVAVERLERGPVRPHLATHLPADVVVTGRSIDALVDLALGPSPGGGGAVLGLSERQHEELERVRADVRRALRGATPEPGGARPLAGDERVLAAGIAAWAAITGCSPRNHAIEAALVPDVGPRVGRLAEHLHDEDASWVDPSVIAQGEAALARRRSRSVRAEDDAGAARALRRAAAPAVASGHRGAGPVAIAADPGRRRVVVPAAPATHDARWGEVDAVLADLQVPGSRSGCRLPAGRGRALVDALVGAKVPLVAVSLEALHPSTRREVVEAFRPHIPRAVRDLAEDAGGAVGPGGLRLDEAGSHTVASVLRRLRGQGHDVPLDAVRLHPESRRAVESSLDGRGIGLVD